MDVLEKLENSLRAVGANHRQTFQVDGFDLFIDPDSDDFYLSFAVPTSSTVWQRSVEAMKDTFIEQGRRARLEYFHELHPGLKEVLEAEGFRLDMSAPVMALESESLSAFEEEQKGNYRQLGHLDGSQLQQALRYQSLAYGGDGGEGALNWYDSMLKGLKSNNLKVAVLEKDGDLVSGASIQIGAGLGELAGVWTHPEKQKQGFAFELCHELLKDYFTTGYDLCWLSAAEGAQRLYQKLGFKTVGTQLNFGLPE